MTHPVDPDIDDLDDDEVEDLGEDPDLGPPNDPVPADNAGDAATGQEESP